MYLHDVLYAPDIRRNIVLVISMMSLGFSFCFENNGVSIYLGTIFYGIGYLLDGFFVLDVDDSSFNKNANGSVSNIASFCDNDSMRWHDRLGHIGQDRMTRLAREGLLGPLARVIFLTCEHYLAGKATRKPLEKAKRASIPLQLIHSDICGPKNMRAKHGAPYFIIFIDDCTRFGHVYLISYKS